MKTKDLVTGAMIGAIYVALNLILAPISFGPIQFRVAEALTILPLISTPAIFGLFVGCIVSNFFGGYGLIDIVFGSLATLLAAYLTYLIGKKVRNQKSAALFGGLPPVLINAVVIGLVLSYATTNTINLLNVFVFSAQIFISEAGVVYALGMPLLYFVKKFGLFRFQNN